MENVQKITQVLKPVTEYVVVFKRDIRCKRSQVLLEESSLDLVPVLFLSCSCEMLCRYQCLADAFTWDT